MRSRWILVGVLVIVGSTAVVVGGTVGSGDTGADAGGSQESVTMADEGPLVDAGLDQTVDQGAVVLLDGGGTWSPDGTISRYEWQITAPDGTEIAPAEPSSPQTRFRASMPGRYEVTLYATDDNGVTGTDTLYISVEPIEPPHVSIVGPERVVTSETATYTAEAVAADGEIERIEWRNGDTGTESTRQITAPPGTTNVSVTVTDDNGLSATAIKEVTVLAPNRRPTAEIRGPSTVTRGSTATFQVDASDPDGSVERIRWANDDSGVTSTRTFDESVGSVVSLRAIVSDDRDGVTTATHAVEIVDHSSSGSFSGSPTIAVEGPREVEPGSSHQYLAETDHSTGEPVSVRWFGEDFADRGDTHDHQFDQPAGSTVQFTAVGTDPGGETASETVTVTIVPVPRVSIEGLPEECVRAGEELTLRANTARSDPTLDYEWQVGGDVVGQGETFTYEFTQDGDTRVTLAATNEAGYTGTTTETVCVNAQNQPPEIRSLSAVWFASTHENPGAPPVEHDAFSSLVNSRFPLVEFSAVATDPDGEDLTYRWDFGDGAVGVTSASDGGETTVSHDYSPTHGRQRDATDYSMTLVVEDEHGATTTATRTVSVRKIFGGSGSYELSADKQQVEVGEPITFTVRNDMAAARHVEGRIVYGNGRYEKADSDRAVSETTTQYDNPGTYTVQFWSGNDDTGQVGLDSQIEITVVKKSYTVYTYGIEEQITRTAPSSPGESWEQGPIDHLERSLEEVRNRTALAHSQEARQLEREGYQAVDQRTEQVQVGTEAKRATSSPGSEWTLEERNVDTVQRQDGWDYKTFNSPQYGSKWSHVKTVRTSEEIRQTTTSTDRPSGSGWSIDSSVGRTQTGWDYGWVDSWSDAPSGATIVDSHRTLVDVETRITCVDRTYYKDFFGHWRSRCVETDRQVVDRTYDTKYKYRVADYSTIWRWERTQTVYDREYHYRKPNYETVSRNRYQKPVYEQRSYVDYQKEIYTTTPYYEWTSTGVVEHSGLEYPTESNVVWVESESYSCPNEGPLAEQACS